MPVSSLKLMFMRETGRKIQNANTTSAAACEGKFIIRVGHAATPEGAWKRKQLRLQ